MGEAVTSHGDAQGRSRGLERTLRDQCSAVWRLTVDGVWACVYRQEVEGLAEIEGFAEFFSSMVSPRLKRGAEITAKMGDWMIMAVVDANGVLVGVRNKLGNPVTIRTAMTMIESRSQRGEAMASTRAPRVVDLGSAKDAAPLRRSQRLSPPTGEVLPEPLSSGWSLDSSRSRASSRVHDDRRAQVTSLPDPPSLDEDDSEGFAFEIVFQDEVSEVEVPEGVGDDITVAAEERADCAWGDVVAHLSLLTEQVRPHIGARVALNYWRDALGQRPELSDYLILDIARARFKAASASGKLDATQRDALTWAQDQWMERCGLVVPHIETVLGALGAAPWI